jgi:outer membrane protein assembly factor BamB
MRVDLPAPRKGAPYVLVLVLAGSLGFPSAQSPQPEWPQLFGASRNAVARASISNGARLTIGWKRPMPSGSAGLVVSGGNVYTLGTDGEQDVLFAIDAKAGNDAGRIALGATHPDALANGPTATPAVVDDLIVTVSTACKLQAVNIGTRQIAWTQDIAAMYASRFAKRGGCGMAPLIAGRRVVIVTGAAEGPRLAAFDVATGTPAWSTTDLPNGYNVAPGWFEADGGFVLYHHTKPPGVSGVTAVNAQTGSIAWQIDGERGESDATPVALPGGRLLIETWPQIGLYDIATRTPVWTSREIVANRSPAIWHDAHIYAFGGQSGEFLTCVDASDGRVQWTSRTYRGHLALAGDTLVLLSESAGLLRLVAADPSGYRELAKVQVLTPGARTGTPPTVAGGRIFVRNLDELVAVDVRP